MHEIEKIYPEDIRRLILEVAPNKIVKLDLVFSQINPVFYLNRTTKEFLFRANSANNSIQVGLECTINLQAHCFSAAIILCSIKDSLDREIEEPSRNFHAAMAFMEWAVSRDLKQILQSKYQTEVDLTSIFSFADREFPTELFTHVPEDEKKFGMQLFQIASAFILLHEIAHLYYRHEAEEGVVSVEQEKDADRFASEWLLTSASQSDEEVQIERLRVLIGISTALLWTTIPHVFFPFTPNKTHPPGYQRLFQVMENGIDYSDDEEGPMIWEFLRRMLIAHMDSAGFEFSEKEQESAD